MHFRHLFPVFFCLACCTATPLAAQCYSSFRQDGIDFYNNGKWASAKASFQEAANCKSDKPANNDLATWIGKCDKKIAEAAERARQRREQEAADRLAQQQAATTRAADDSFWEALKDGDIADCDKYLRKYPNGLHASEARRRKEAMAPPLVKPSTTNINRENNNSGGHGGYAIGDIAEDFFLKNVDGNIVSLSNYRDAKGIIVVFTCNDNPYAQLYEQRIIDLHRKFAPLGFPVVAINPNSPLIVPEDSFEKMQERARSKHYPFAYLFDEKQMVYPKFGATRTPHVFVLDANHVVRYIGAIDNNPEAPSASTQRWAENAVEALLKGANPNPNSTKSVGGTIKKAPK